MVGQALLTDRKPFYRSTDTSYSTNYDAVVSSATCLKNSVQLQPSLRAVSGDMSRNGASLRSDFSWNARQKVTPKCTTPESKNAQKLPSFQLLYFFLSF